MEIIQPKKPMEQMLGKSHPVTLSLSLFQSHIRIPTIIIPLAFGLTAPYHWRGSVPIWVTEATFFSPLHWLSPISLRVLDRSKNVLNAQTLSFSALNIVIKALRSILQSFRTVILPHQMIYFTRS